MEGKSGVLAVGFKQRGASLTGGAAIDKRQRVRDPSVLVFVFAGVCYEPGHHFWQFTAQLVDVDVLREVSRGLKG